MVKSIAEEGWYSVDLHVHTPASRDYKGNKDRNEYKEIILRTYDGYKKDDKKKTEDSSNINLLAITDHNSVDGFKAIMAIKKETSDLIIKLKERDPNLEFIQELQKEEEKFNSVHILMGVEIKPDPGVHLLVIFHEGIVPDDVELFIKDGLGVEKDKFNGDPNMMLKWSIAQTLEEIQTRFRNKALVIAPHVDSSNGLIESLKQLPQVRMIALKHPMLKAVSFNNADTREWIRKLLLKPEYKRESSLVFVQASDYHGDAGRNIGSSYSKVYLGRNRKLSYSSLSEAFSKEQNVKCSIDFIQDIYADTIEGYNVKRFVSYSTDKLMFHESDYTSLCDTVCAYLNTKGGIIEIEGSLATVADDKTEIIKDLHLDMEKIFVARLKPLPKFFGTSTLRMSNVKFKHLILFRSSTRLYMSDGKVLVFKNGSPCPAAPNEIEHIVARNLNNSYGISIEDKLEELTYETQKISKSQRSYPIAVKYENKLVKSFTKKFDFDFLNIHNKIDELNTMYKKFSNGVADGNMEVSLSAEKPRRNYSYLRFSVPSFNVSSITEENSQLNEKSGLLIVPRGGIMFTSGGKQLHAGQPTILLHLKTDENILSYLAWFKSSYFLWYCATIIGDVDMFSMIASYRRKIPLPNKTLLSCLDEATTYVNNVLLDEKNFLKEYQKHIEREQKETVDKFIEKHNKNLDAQCINIDIEVFKCFGISSEEAYEIYNILKYLNIYTFNIDENQECRQKFKVLDEIVSNC